MTMLGRSLKDWHPGALVRFGANWNGHDKPAALGLVISVELIPALISETTGGRVTVMQEYVNAVVWDYDGTIRELKFANTSAWEPID